MARQDLLKQPATADRSTQREITTSLFAQLRSGGLSSRVANILIHRIGITSLEDLRTRHWHGDRLQQGLRDQLLKVQGSGLKVVVEVQAYLAGLNPAKEPTIPTTILLPIERHLLEALDAWIAAQPGATNRADAIHKILDARLRRVSRPPEEQAPSSALRKSAQLPREVTRVETGARTRTGGPDGAYPVSSAA